MLRVGQRPPLPLQIFDEADVGSRKHVQRALACSICCVNWPVEPKLKTTLWPVSAAKLLADFAERVQVKSDAAEHGERRGRLRGGGAHVGLTDTGVSVHAASNKLTRSIPTKVLVRITHRYIMCPTARVSGKRSQTRHFARPRLAPRDGCATRATRSALPS